MGLEHGLASVVQEVVRRDREDRVLAMGDSGWGRRKKREGLCAG